MLLSVAGMDTIELKGCGVFHGAHRGNVGVYKDKDGRTYAGQRKGAVAHGYGVVTWSDGRTSSGQFANGDWHGHVEIHYANGDVWYQLCERGKRVHFARVRPDGQCEYDGEPCGADHAGHVALKVRVCV